MFAILKREVKALKETVRAKDIGEKRKSGQNG